MAATLNVVRTTHRSQQPSILQKKSWVPLMQVGKQRTSASLRIDFSKLSAQQSVHHARPQQRAAATEPATKLASLLPQHGNDSTDAEQPSQSDRPAAATPAAPPTQAAAQKPAFRPGQRRAAVSSHALPCSAASSCTSSASVAAGAQHAGCSTGGHSCQSRGVMRRRVSFGAFGGAAALALPPRLRGSCAAIGAACHLHQRLHRSVAALASRSPAGTAGAVSQGTRKRKTRRKKNNTARAPAAVSESEDEWEDVKSHSLAAAVPAGASKTGAKASASAAPAQQSKLQVPRGAPAARKATPRRTQASAQQSAVQQRPAQAASNAAAAAEASDSASPGDDEWKAFASSINPVLSKQIVRHSLRSGARKSAPQPATTDDSAQASAAAGTAAQPRKAAAVGTEQSTKSRGRDAQQASQTSTKVGRPRAHSSAAQPALVAPRGTRSKPTRSASQPAAPAVSTKEPAQTSAGAAESNAAASDDDDWRQFASVMPSGPRVARKVYRPSAKAPVDAAVHSNGGEATPPVAEVRKADAGVPSPLKKRPVNSVRILKRLKGRKSVREPAAPLAARPQRSVSHEAPSAADADSSESVGDAVDIGTASAAPSGRTARRQRRNRRRARERKRNSQQPATLGAPAVSTGVPASPPVSMGMPAHSFPEESDDEWDAVGTATAVPSARSVRQQQARRQTPAAVVAAQPSTSSSSGDPASVGSADESDDEWAEVGTASAVPAARSMRHKRASEPMPAAAAPAAPVLPAASRMSSGPVSASSADESDDEWAEVGAASAVPAARSMQRKQAHKPADSTPTTAAARATAAESSAEGSEDGEDEWEEVGSAASLLPLRRPSWQSTRSRPAAAAPPAARPAARVATLPNDRAGLRVAASSSRSQQLPARGLREAADAPGNLSEGETVAALLREHESAGSASSEEHEWQEVQSAAAVPSARESAEQAYKERRKELARERSHARKLRRQRRRNQRRSRQQRDNTGERWAAERISSGPGVSAAPTQSVDTPRTHREVRNGASAEHSASRRASLRSAVRLPADRTPVAASWGQYPAHQRTAIERGGAASQQSAAHVTRGGSASDRDMTELYEEQFPDLAHPSELLHTAAQTVWECDVGRLAELVDEVHDSTLQVCNPASFAQESARNDASFKGACMHGHRC